MSKPQTPEPTSTRSSRRSSRRGSSASGRGQISEEDEIQLVAEGLVAPAGGEAEVRVIEAEVHEPSNPPTPEPPRRSARLKSKKNPSEASSAPSTRNPSPEPSTSTSKSSKPSSKDSTTPKSIIKKAPSSSSSKHVTPKSSKASAPIVSPRVPIEEAYPEFAPLKGTNVWPLCNVLLGALRSLQVQAHDRSTAQKEEFLQENLNVEQILACAKELQKAYTPPEQLMQETEERIASRLVSDLLMKTQSLKEEIDFPFDNYWIELEIDPAKARDPLQPNQPTGRWDHLEVRKPSREFFEPYSKTIRTRFSNLELDRGDEFRAFFEKMMEIDDNIHLSPQQVCVLVDLTFSDQAARIFKNARKNNIEIYKNNPVRGRHPVNMALKEIYDMLPSRTVLKVRLQNDFCSSEINARVLAPDMIDQTLSKLHALAKDAFPVFPDSEIAAIIKLKLMMTLPKEMRLLLLTQEERRKAHRLPPEKTETLFNHMRFWSGRTSRNFRGHSLTNLHEIHLYNDAEYGIFQTVCRNRKIPFSIPDVDSDVILEGALPDTLDPFPQAGPRSDPLPVHEWKEQLQEVIQQNAQMNRDLLQQQNRFFQSMLQQAPIERETVYHVPQLAITDQTNAQPLSSSAEVDESSSQGTTSSKNGKKGKKNKKKKGSENKPDELNANLVSSADPTAQFLDMVFKGKNPIYKTPPKNAEARIITLGDKNFEFHQKNVYDLYKDIPFNVFVEENLKLLRIPVWWKNRTKKERRRDKFARLISDLEPFSQVQPIFYKKGNQYFLARSLIELYKKNDCSFCCSSKECAPEFCEFSKQKIIYCHSCKCNWHASSDCQMVSFKDAEYL